MKTKLSLAAFFCVLNLFPVTSFAINNTGVISTLIIGRGQNEVMFGFSNASPNSCVNHHPQLQYGFRLDNRPDAKAMLAALIAAKVSGQTIGLVGSNNCNLDGPDYDVEEVGYIWW